MSVGRKIRTELQKSLADLVAGLTAERIGIELRLEPAVGPADQPFAVVFLAPPLLRQEPRQSDFDRKRNVFLCVQFLDLVEYEVNRVFLRQVHKLFGRNCQSVLVQ